MDPTENVHLNNSSTQSNNDPYNLVSSNNPIDLSNIVAHPASSNTKHQIDYILSDNHEDGCGSEEDDEDENMNKSEDQHKDQEYNPMSSDKEQLNNQQKDVNTPPAGKKKNKKIRYGGKNAMTIWIKILSKIKIISFCNSS